MVVQELGLSVPERSSELDCYISLSSAEKKTITVMAASFFLEQDPDRVSLQETTQHFKAF